MISNSQREHLTYSLLGQLATIGAMGFIIYQYVLPGFDTIAAREASVNGVISTYDNYKINGLPISTFENELAKRPERAELYKLLQSDPQGAASAIVKTGGDDYIKWLKISIAQASDDQQEVKNFREAINSIIPTMNPIAGGVADPSAISLKQYIRFIETKFIKEFNLQIDGALGVNGVTYGNGRDGIPEMIGSYSFPVSLNGTNASIDAFLSYIKESGNPKNLISTGSVRKSEGALSNPLITITDFSLSEKFDPVNAPDAPNSGRIGLRLYVRGTSKVDIDYLREAVKTKENYVNTLVTKARESCEKQGITCTTKTDLNRFEKDYREYTRSDKGIGRAQGSEIYTLIQVYNTLTSYASELEKKLGGPSKVAEILGETPIK